MTSSQTVNVALDYPVLSAFHPFFSLQSERMLKYPVTVDVSDSAWPIFYSLETERAGNLVQIPQSISVNFLTVEDVIRQKLGDRAANRFLELKRIDSGWRFGEGEALRADSELNFSALLLSSLHPPRDAKLFLADDGSIEMQWKTNPESRFSLVCGEETFLFLRKGSAAERRFPKRDLTALVKMVRRETVYVNMLYQSSCLADRALTGLRTVRNKVEKFFNSSNGKTPKPT